MNQEVKKTMLKMADDSYKSGFNDACEVLIEGLDHMYNNGFRILPIESVKELIMKTQEEQKKQTTDWSKFGL